MGHFRHTVVGPSDFLDNATGASICLTGDQLPLDLAHVDAVQIAIKLHKRGHAHPSKLGVNQVGDRLNVDFT